MRYLTHSFANLETLDRARRWLVQAGFDPSQIEAITEGIPRIAIRVDAGQAAEASMIIDAAELTDPNGLPSFWDLARQKHIHTAAATAPEPSPTEAEQSRTFVVTYHVPDERPDLGSSVEAVQVRDALQDWLGS